MKTNKNLNSQKWRSFDCTGSRQWKIMVPRFFQLDDEDDRRMDEPDTNADVDTNSDMAEGRNDTAEASLSPPAKVKDEAKPKVTQEEDMKPTGKAEVKDENMEIKPKVKQEDEMKPKAEPTKVRKEDAESKDASAVSSEPQQKGLHVGRTGKPMDLPLRTLIDRVGNCICICMSRLFIPTPNPAP